MNEGTLFTGVGGATGAATAAEVIEQIILHAQPEEGWPVHLNFIRPEVVELEGLDPGIADAVHLLRRYGVPTFASCEGGEGHSFQHPTIRIHTRYTFRYRGPALVRPETIARLLTSAGYAGFYIKRVDCYQNTAEPWKSETMSFFEVEFWAEKDQIRPTKEVFDLGSIVEPLVRYTDHPNVMIENDPLVPGAVRREQIEAMVRDHAVLVVEHDTDNFTFEMPWRPGEVYKPDSELISWFLEGEARPLAEEESGE